MTWQIFVDGKFVGGELTSIRQELNAPETAKFLISNDITGRELVDADSTVVIKYLSETVWTGTLQGIKYQQRYLECTCYDTVYDLLAKKVINEDFDAKTVSTILTAIAGEVSGVSGSTTDAGAVNHTVTFRNAICYDAIKFLAQLANLDYYSSGGNTINIASRGTHRGVIPIESVSRRGINRHQKRDKVIVRGQDVNGVDITGEAEAGAGTDVAVYTEKRAQTTDSLDALAANYLAQLNKDSSGVNLTINIVYAYKLQPGDTIEINNPTLNLNGTYKIWRITKKDATATVEVDVPEELLQRIIDKQKGFEDLGIITYNTQLDDPVGAPATVASVVTSNEIGGIKVSWAENSEADLDYYQIWRADTLGGAKTKIADARTTYFTDVGTAYNDYQWYSIKAVDRVGNVAASYSAPASGAAQKILGSDLLDNTIDTLQIANNAVDYAQLAVDAVRGAVISAAAITREKILDGAVTSGVLSAGSITREKLIDGAVTSGVLSAGSITRSKLLDGVVTSGVIAAGTVTASEVKAGAITAAGIRSHTITSAEIYAGTITASEMQAGSITSAAIRANTITAGDIYAGTITASEMKAGSITSAAIRAGTIVAGDIAASAITSVHIAAGTIVALDIATNAITADKIVAGAVTALKMAADAIQIGLSGESIEIDMPFEEQTGVVTADFSGNDNAGTFDSAMAWSTAGRFGGCVYSDGTGTTGTHNSNIQLASDVTATGALSVSMWLKPDAGSLAGNRGLCGNDTVFADGRITINAEVISFVTATATTTIDITGELTEGAWNHLVITRDAANALLVYVNGVDVTPGSPVQAGNIVFRRLFDNPDNSSWQSWKGFADGFKLFARTISATDVLALYRYGDFAVKQTQITGGMIKTGTITVDKITGGTISADMVTLNGIDGSGDLVLTAIGSGTLGNIPDGGGYAKVDSDLVSGGFIKVRSITGSVASYAASSYTGQGIYFTTEDTVYYSNGTTWVDTGLSDEDVWGYSSRKLTHLPLANSWWGSGRDGGSVTISTNTYTSDQVKMYGSLTVNAGTTLSASGALVIYCSGTLYLRGNIAIKPDQVAPSGGICYNAGAIYDSAGHGGRGGVAGGTCLIFAKTIRGSGIIYVNGASGGNAVTQTDHGGSDSWGIWGEDGWSGNWEGASYPGGGGGTGGGTSYSIPAGWSIEPLTGKGGWGGPKFWNASILALKYAYAANLTGMPIISAIGGAGGAGGGGGLANGDTYDMFGAGGGGGGGFGGDGGDGGWGEIDAGSLANPEFGTGGGGGGAGGLCAIVTETNNGGWKVWASGGNGGDGDSRAVDGAGGGGGGGGVCIVIANSGIGSGNFHGIAGKSGASTAQVERNAQDGTAGTCYFFELEDFTIAQA